jgi:hypothetical protein
MYLSIYLSYRAFTSRDSLYSLNNRTRNTMRDTSSGSLFTLCWGLFDPESEGRQGGLGLHQENPELLIFSYYHK